MNLFDINGHKLHLPRDIEIVNKGHELLKMHILKPCSNMQEDGSAFEGWCLILKANIVSENIILSFKEIQLEKNDYFKNLNSGQQHYMRFLYRLCKFEKQMKSWFKISEDNRNCIDLFKKNFSTVMKINNIPDSDSSYDPGKGMEHILEKSFIHFKDFGKENKINFELYDQLPNGLFVGEVCEKNRIFNTGYFDLWGIDESDQSLCIFELKKPGNTKVGIISEAYFYANFAHDLLSGKDNFTLNNNNGKFRGYKELCNSKIKQIKMYFLVNKLHSEFEKKQNEIIELLNSNTKITYHVQKYDIDAKKISDLKMRLKEYYS